MVGDWPVPVITGFSGVLIIWWGACEAALPLERERDRCESSTDKMERGASEMIKSKNALERARFACSLRPKTNVAKYASERCAYIAAILYTVYH